MNIIDVRYYSVKFKMLRINKNKKFIDKYNM